MKRIGNGVIIMLLLGTTVLATADQQSTEFSKEYSACFKKGDGTTQAMLECVYAELTRQDTRLNKAYKDLLSSLKTERQKQLQDAQRAWIKFRDADVNFQADPDGGTIAQLFAAQTSLQMTADRAAELEGILSEEK